MKQVHLIPLGFCLAVIAAAGPNAQEREARPGPPAPRLPEGVQALRDLTYVTNGHERHRLDLFVPAAADRPLPLLIWVHGGGWQGGGKEGCPPLRNGYPERGYAVASINYRLSSHASFPAQIEDCKAAIRWLRAHAGKYHLDPGRFGVWGSSAGGHLVALLGTSGDVKEFDAGEHLDQSSRVQAVCDYYGPTDFTVFVTTPGYDSHAGAESPEAKLLGGAVMEYPDRAARANPVTYVSPDDPPFLIVHGDQDRTVPINQSQLLFDALKRAGVNVHFHTIRGAGHGQGFGGPEIEPMVSAFFDKHLKSPAPPATRGEAATSESPASSRAAAPGRPGSGLVPGRPTVTWKQVRAREGLDEDGRLPRARFKGPPALFDRLDRNGDGLLSKEDFTDQPAPGPAPVHTAPAKSPATRMATGEFQLSGERWTYRNGDFSMSGILLKPPGRGPFPAVLISHGLGGGAESFGLQKAREMVQWGLVCIAPNYTHSGNRGAPQAAGPAGRGPHRVDFGASAENLRRARTCLELARSLPEVDGTRLAAYGHSMGGFVTIGLAASAPELLKAAAITGAGVAPQEGFPAPSATAAAAVRTPFLILHGGADPVVRPEQSAALQQALERNKVPNERHLFPGAGHPIDQTQRQEIYSRIRAWFGQHGLFAARGPSASSQSRP